MKAKIYPYDTTLNELEAINSSFCLQIEIICASLAKGSSTIKGLIFNKEVDTTIAGCKSIGANIKKGNDKLTEKINGALKELKDEGKVQEILDKYINAE